MLFLRRIRFKILVNYLGQSAKMSSLSSDEILFEVKNRCGLITLNKPKALNSINMKMAQAINEHLLKWENQVSMILIRGVGKAFCAGGDIKESVECGPEKCDAAKAFFKLDYKNDYLIANFKHPYIAIMDGITMGSGAGLSINGRYRVSTEKTLFAMPETAIGLFPDVGASYFLSRLPGNMGMFLALTGHRLRGVDCNHLGLATHYCCSEDIPQLIDGLISSGGNVEKVETELAKTCKDISDLPFSLADKRPLIDKIFGQPSVEAIVEGLKAEGSDWSKGTLATLMKMSPLSLKVTHKEMTLGKTLSLKCCIEMECKLCCNALNAKFSRDFYEGVRALLIDKDKNPRWNPARLEDIPTNTVDHYFAAGQGTELVL